MIVAGYSGQVEYVLIGAKHIRTLNDVKGKNVGVTGSGGVAEFATVEALRKKSMIRDKDYTIVFAGNSPARVLALERGIIHAAPFSSGETIPLVKTGYPVLLDIGETLPELPFLVITTAKRKLESAPGEVEAVLRALHKAMMLIKEKSADVITHGLKQTLKGNAELERQNIRRYAKHYSISINETNVKTLIRGARIEAEAAQIGGARSFFNAALAERVAGTVR
jgi:ABC-type nitrate/sulfonate/bicarbonate transport system substrate-binding protein